MNIVIIGCGFAGLSSALFLSRSENKITIIDKFSQVSTIGAGIMIQPSSQKILKELGLYEELINNGEKIHSIIGINHNKKQVFGTFYKDNNDESFGVGIHRSVLFNMMYEKCLEKENIKFKLGTEVNNITDLSHEYDLVIVANGSHSKLKENLPIKQSYKLYPYGCVWATVEDETTTSNKLQQYVCYAKEMFGILPSGLKDGKRILSVFWSLPIIEKETYSKDEMFKCMEKHHSDPVLMNKIKSADFSFATYADVWMQKYHYKNIVVIGDAAHGMSPQLGQGANMAFLDAYYLNKVLDVNNIESSLQNYTKIRKPHLSFYSQASKFLTPLYQSDKKIYGIFRDIVFFYAQKIRIARFISSHILCGKRINWWNKKEISYEQ